MSRGGRKMWSSLNLFLLYFVSSYRPGFINSDEFVYCWFCGGQRFRLFVEKFMFFWLKLVLKRSPYLWVAGWSPSIYVLPLWLFSILLASIQSLPKDQKGHRTTPVQLWLCQYTIRSRWWWCELFAFVFFILIITDNYHSYLKQSTNCWYFMKLTIFEISYPYTNLWIE